MRTIVLALLLCTFIPTIPAFAQGHDIRIGYGNSSGGTWSGGNPDIWSADNTVDPNRTVNAGEIVSRLNGGLSVTILNAYGSIIDSASVAILKSAGGDAVLRFSASGSTSDSDNVVFNANDTIRSTSGALTIIIGSDGDGTGNGAIRTNAGCHFVTNGGTIILGGGADPEAEPAQGSPGIRLLGTVIDAGAGAVLMRGRAIGYGAGIDIAENASISTSTGNIVMTGAGAYDVGVVLSGSAILSQTGRIGLNGTAAPIGYGMIFHPGTTVSSVNGSVVLHAAGIGSGYPGLFLDGGTGPVTVESQHGDSLVVVSSCTGYSFSTVYQGTVTFGSATFVGEMLFESDGPVNHSFAAGTLRGAGTLTFRPARPEASIGVASQSGDYRVGYLSSLPNGFRRIVIGRSDGTGSIAVGNFTGNDPVTILSGSGNIHFPEGVYIPSDELVIQTNGVVTHNGVIVTKCLRLYGGTFNLKTKYALVDTLYVVADVVRFWSEQYLILKRLIAREADLTIPGLNEYSFFMTVERLILDRTTLTISDTVRTLILRNGGRLIQRHEFAADTLIMEQGEIYTNGANFNLGTSASSAVHLAITSGFVQGKFKRWFKADTISNVLFPANNYGYFRPLTLSFTTAPGSTGSVTSEFTYSSSNTSGLPVADADSGIVSSTLVGGYWTLIASEGLNGATYSVDLAATGFAGVTQYQNLKVLRRIQGSSNWTLSGTHAAGTGSNSSPVAHRTGLTGIGGYSYYSVGQGVMPAPIFSGSPASIAFGGTAVGGVKIDSVRVRNTGNLAMNVTAVTSNNALYTVTQGDTVVGIGESVYYRVTFAPTAFTSSTATLTIAHDAAGSPYTVGLSGKGVAVEPTVAASALWFSSVTASTMTIHWTKGDGAKRLVLVRSGEAVTSQPVDGTSYFSPSTVYGTGGQIGTGNFLVHSGTGDSVTVTGLISSSVIHVAVIEYNGESGTENYLNTPIASGSQTTTAVTTEPTAGNALSLDGMDDYVSVGTPAGLCTQIAATVEVWVRIPVEGAGAGYRGIVVKDWQYYIFLKNNVLIAYDMLQSMIEGEESGDRSTGIALNDGEWHHIAMTVNEWGYVTIYLDGMPTSVSSGEIWSAEPSLPLNIGFGSTGYSDGYMKGTIDEVRIWNGMRTLEQIRSDMHSLPVELPTGIAAVYQFNEGSGTVAADRSGQAPGTLVGGIAWTVSTVPVGRGTDVSVPDIIDGTADLGTLSMALTEPFDNVMNLHASTITVAPNVLPTGSLLMLGDRYWIVRPYGMPGIFTADVTFNVPSAFTNNGIGSPSLYTLYSRPSCGTGNWTAVASAASLTASTITFAGITAFSQFMLGTNDPMPVELTGFTCRSMRDEVKLEWSSATEKECHGYTVERRYGDSTWRSVGFVTGHGSTNAANRYEFTDLRVPDGIQRYRLRIDDLDGAFSYSSIVETMVHFIPSAYALLPNFPNPFNPITSIRFQLPVAGNVLLSVHDLLGRDVKLLVNGPMDAGVHSVLFDASSLPSGIYFARLIAGGQSQIRKMLLMK